MICSFHEVFRLLGFRYTIGIEDANVFAAEHGDMVSLCTKLRNELTVHKMELSEDLVRSYYELVHHGEY